MRLPISDLPPILHRFRDIAFDRSKIAIFGYPCCVYLPHHAEGFLKDDRREIVREFQRVATVPNGEETLLTRNRKHRRAAAKPAACAPNAVNTREQGKEGGRVR